MDYLRDFIYSCDYNVNKMLAKEEEFEKNIESEVEKLAQKKEEELFAAHKKEYQLEVLKKLQAEGVKKEGVELSSSYPLISDSYTLDGIELQPYDFIPDALSTDAQYEDTIIVKNMCTREYQEVNNKTGRRRRIWKEMSTLVLICNPFASCNCEEIVVFLKGVKKPLHFQNGNISEEAFRKQTPFTRKGINVSVKRQLECFLRDLRECPNKKFLTLPKHAGGISLPNGVTTYISAESVIPGLAELFPTEVREHKMVSHALSLKDTAAIYRKSLPNCLETTLATTVRIESILLPLFGAEGLHTDRVFSISYNNEVVRETVITLIKRKNYTSTVVQSLTAHITKVRKELAAANDITVLLMFSGIFDEGNNLENAFKEVLWDITGANGDEDNTRKIIIFINDCPERIPDDYPIYYINCGDDIIPKNVPFLQRLSGMFDYAFKEYIYNNPDTTRQLVRDGLKAAHEYLINIHDIEVSNSMMMTLSTGYILKQLGLFTGSDIQSISNWFGTNATSRTTMTDTIYREFMSAVSVSILNGELKIAKQYGSPYYMADGHTAFIAENDKSINMDDDVIENVIIPTLHTKSVVKMNKHLKEKGVLKGKHTNKRKLKVAFNAGVLDDVEIFSYSRSVLNAEAKAFVDDIIENEFWSNVDEYPEGFIPILYNVDGTRAAGYVFKTDMDDNLHEVYFGTSRSGKTFALVNRALQKGRFQGADAVIILDQTEGLTSKEIEKHIGKETMESYFSFWNVYKDGLPVDLLDLRGCLSYKDKKDRLLRIYTMMSRTLGSYEEQILKNVIKRMLKDMSSNPNMTIFDISQYICEDIKEDESLAKDDTHRKLLYKLDAVLDDLRGTPLTKNNWGEFAKVHGKPIVVISTGADGVGKGSEIIDILLESLYSYKQCHPHEKYTVVIDEAQDLYLHEKGAVNTLLRKGGKHGVTMLLASQSFPDPSTPFGKVVGNCGRFRGYRSKGDDLARYVERFGCDKHEADALSQGHCFDNGLFWSRYRTENVITTLKGKTVHFEPAPESNENTKKDDEQP